MWATRVLLLIPQLALVPYLIGTIGEAGYGLYVLVWSLMLSIDELEKSLQSGVVKYSAGFVAQGRMHEVNQIVSSSFAYSILLAVVASATILGAAAFGGTTWNQMNSALVVIGIMLLFIFPLTPYIAIIQGRQRYYVGAIAETISKYVSVLAVVAWFHTMGPSLEALIVIMAGALFLARLAQVPIAYRLVPGFQNRLGLVDLVHFRLIASFGAATVLVSLCLAANSTGVRWLMDWLASASFVAHLTIMVMPLLLMYQVMSAISLTIMPATSGYEATGNERMLLELLVRGMRYSTILSLSGLLVAVLLMRDALRVWVGPDYLFLAPYALALFASGAFMSSTSVAHHMLKGLGKLQVVAFIYFFGLVVVPFSLIIGIFHIWRNPYIAVTAGLAFGHLTCGCLNVIFGARVVKTRLRGVLIRVYLQPLLVASAVWLVVAGTAAIRGVDSLIANSLASVFAVLLFFGGCYALISTATERQQLKGILQLAAKGIPALGK
jgi:O-antigen/teichoic acid export membrane protein